MSRSTMRWQPTLVLLVLTLAMVCSTRATAGTLTVTFGNGSGALGYFVYDATQGGNNNGKFDFSASPKTHVIDYGTAPGDTYNSGMDDFTTYVITTNDTSDMHTFHIHAVPKTGPTIDITLVLRSTLSLTALPGSCSTFTTSNLSSGTFQLSGSASTNITTLSCTFIKQFACEFVEPGLAQPVMSAPAAPVYPQYVPQYVYAPVQRPGLFGRLFGRRFCGGCGY
jgi:hypothetical protein